MHPSAGSRAVWSELVPYRELCEPRVLSLLRSRSLSVQVAVTPNLVHGVGDVVRACRAAGVRVGLWPMLERHAGRWPSASNVEAFVTFVDELLEVLDRGATLPDELAIDLEPPIFDLGRLLRLEAQVIARRLVLDLRPDVVQRYCDLVHAIHGRGITTLAAVLPVLLSDRPGTGGWQRFLGTPTDEPPFSRVTVMLYSSLIEGYGRGAVSRHDALSLLAVAARATAKRYGQGASLSLGAAGTGALGDEPTYRSCAELVEDVAVARAAGIDDLLLFSLGGVLARPRPEAWLDALVATEPAAQLPSLTPRAAAIVAASFAASRAMSLTRWLADQQRLR
jgi:hypothetical protein